MEKKVRAVACIAVVILLMMMSVPGVALSLRVNHGQEEGIGLYNTGWYIENGQGGRKTVDLPYQNRVPAGQELRISHDIAQEDQGRWLYFQLTYEFLSVYVDDDPEPVYCQETESVGSFKHDEIPVNGFDYIQIPEGKKLTFVLSSPYDNYGGKLGLVYIGDSEADLLYLNYTTYRYSYFIDVFLVGMGCLWFIYGICKVFAREKSGVMIHLGLLALSLGICFRYGTVDADMRQSTVLAMAISRFSGFLAPVFFCGFLQFYFPEKRKKYQFWQMLFLVDIAMMVLLAVTGTFDVPETTVSMYLLLAGCGLCVLYDLFWQYVRGMMDDRKVSVLGFVILLALIVLEFLEGYFTKMPTGSNIRFGIVVLSLFVGADELFNNQMEKLAQLRQAANRREMQLDEVLSQLQPPFLFHALDFIRETAPLEPESAESLIGDFSRFLKGSVQALESVETVPFSQELEQIKAYLKLEEGRYDRRIRYTVEVETKDFKVPPMSILALVANAVQRGLKKGKEAALVVLRVRRQGEIVTVEVSDNGSGYEMEMYSIGQMNGTTGTEREDINVDEKAYLGMGNVCARLKAVSGASIQIDSETGRGMTVRVELKKTLKR